MSVEFENEIKEYLLSDRYGRGGKTTGEIANRFKLTNRQCGGYMAALKREGKVFSYTKGTIVFTNFLSRKPEPCVLSNSFYEWIGE